MQGDGCSWLPQPPGAQLLVVAVVQWSVLVSSASAGPSCEFGTYNTRTVRPSQTVDENEDGFEILATFYDDLYTKKFIAKSCTSSSYF